MALAFVYAGMSQASPQIRRESGYGAADRLLNAPTNEAWIDPWVAHLRTLGVRFISGHRVAELVVSGGRVSEVRLQPTDANGDPTTTAGSSLDADRIV